MPTANRRLAPAKSTARSRVTNGADLLPGIDGRSIVARRYRDIATAIVIDMGGLDRCSEARLQLVRRFAAAAVLAEQLEARLANGERIDVAEHAHLTSTMTRVAQRIGIERRAAQIVPTLRDYLESRAIDTEDDDTEAHE